MSTVLGVALVAGGVAMAAYAIGVLLSELRFAVRSTTVTGTVIALHPVGKTPSAISEVGMTYCPIIRFVDRAGRDVDFQSTVGYSPPRHRAGDEVTVQYDPRRPQRARAYEKVNLRVPVGMSLSALMFFGFAFVFLELT